MIAAGSIGAFAHHEMRTSALQARYLSGWARELAYRVEDGPSAAIVYPTAGPFDERLGYTRIGAHAQRLASRDFTVAAQARQSPALQRFIGGGFYPPHPEKTQAGLGVLDCRGDAVFSTRYPQHVYRSAEEIPPLVTATLAFIENRELLATTHTTTNPAVEWARLGRAVVDRAISWVDPDHPAAGGSTLATQLEKYRHSPEGRTASVEQKFRQVVSASVRAYRDGEETTGARRRILLDYINSVPFGAVRGYGEVHGLLDAMAAWYGADVDEANRALREGGEAGLAERALAYREVVSLLIAQRRPSHYFGAGQDQLVRMTDSYLRVLAEAGVIEPALRDAALPLRPRVREAASAHAGAAEVADQKAANLIRFELASLLDTPRLYSLDRYDLEVASTIDGRLQRAATELLDELRKPQAARAAGLVGHQLLERGDPSQLVYSFTLYERAGGANRVRVQTDNLDQPFDLNAGAKLELGSTAKLRTLASHLEAVAALHAKLAPLGPKALRQHPVARQDRLTRWAVDHLSQASDRSLAAMLEAAMQRRYSASPAEGFFTGSGLHRFENFHSRDDAKTPTLYEALQDSVNLVFIRLMRDLVQHHIYREPGNAAEIFEGRDHPQREELLVRFAEKEGLQFSRGFYRKYQGKSPDDVLARLASGVRPTPNRLAVVFRSVAPEATVAELGRFIQRHAGTPLAEDKLRSLYEQHAPGQYSLADRGYLAGVHPLELSIAARIRAKPRTTFADIVESARDERQEVYAWLFRTRATRAQDRRILSLLEVDAFAEIHRGWARLGYPFDSLVPSYATAIGSSGDRPAALAELMGIIVGDGKRYPSAAIERLHFAGGTPYDTALALRPDLPQEAMTPEVAAILRKALAGVVEQGTAKRIAGALDVPAGEPIAIGGKTGTGDNRLESRSARGGLVASKVVNRTATFVFYLGERHFGTLTAFVPGPQAQGFRFTSALPVQILKTMAPLLQSALTQAEAGCPPSPAAAERAGQQTAALRQ